MTMEVIYNEVTLNKESNIAALVLMALAMVLSVWFYMILNTNYASEIPAIIQTEVQTSENSMIMTTDTGSWKKGW